MFVAKNKKRNLKAISLLLGAPILFAVGCSKQVDEKSSEPAAVAETQVSTQGTETFEQFEARTYRGDDGVYIAQYDEPIENKESLREYYDNYVASDALSRTLRENDLMRQNNQLIIHKPGGVLSLWNSTNKKQLTYCVSTSFGSRYNEAVVQMERAAQAWEAVASVDFTHLSAYDSNCTAQTSQVLFDVNPVNTTQYLARAFFPDFSRSTRNVLIADNAFTASVGLLGILRHELGHVLGFRHEHTRPDSGTCYEDSQWESVTAYDSDSVMHYPQCNGTSSDLHLSVKDMDGIACVYGPAPGYTPQGNATSNACIMVPDIVTGVTAPTGMTAKGSNSLVTLDWNDSSASTFVGYNLYRSTTSSGGYSVIASNLTSSQYSDNAVVNGTTYYYVATTLGSGNVESAYSSEVSAKPDKVVAGACTVNYTVTSDWGTGFGGSVTVTNNSSSAIDGWTTAWSFAGNQQVTSLWNGSHTQSGTVVSVSNPSWGSVIGANSSVQFGFNGTYSGSNTVPTTFTLNGMTCN